MDGSDAGTLGTDPVTVGMGMARSFDMGIFMGNGIIRHNRPSLFHRAFSLVDITSLNHGVYQIAICWDTRLGRFC